MNKKKTPYAVREMLASNALLDLVAKKLITDREALLYLIMRQHAFPLKNDITKRHRVKKSASFFAELLGVHRNKVALKFKSLEKSGLIQPYFRTKVGDEIVEFDCYKKARKYSILNILGTEYAIKNLPNEKAFLKDYESRKYKK